MDKLFSDGTVAMLILGFMTLEGLSFLALGARRHLTGRHRVALLASLAAGAALIMAFNAALHGARWQVLAQWLLLALIAHLIDVICRILIHSHLTGHRYEH